MERSDDAGDAVHRIDNALAGGRQDYHELPRPPAPGSTRPVQLVESTPIVTPTSSTVEIDELTAALVACAVLALHGREFRRTMTRWWRSGHERRDS